MQLLNAHMARTTPIIGFVGRGELLPRLRMLRVQRLWTQAELAERSDVRRSTISRIESEPNKAADFDTIRKLADALGVTPSELMRAAE